MPCGLLCEYALGYTRGGGACLRQLPLFQSECRTSHVTRGGKPHGQVALASASFALACEPSRSAASRSYKLAARHGHVPVGIGETRRGTTRPPASITVAWAGGVMVADEICLIFEPMMSRLPCVQFVARCVKHPRILNKNRGFGFVRHQAGCILSRPSPIRSSADQT